MQLLLFDHVDDACPSRTITLDPVTNHSRHYWHVFVPGIGVGQIYGYRVDGAFGPEQGLRLVRLAQDRNRTGAYPDSFSPGELRSVSRELPTRCIAVRRSWTLLQACQKPPISRDFRITFFTIIAIGSRSPCFQQKGFWPLSRESIKAFFNSTYDPSSPDALPSTKLSKAWQHYSRGGRADLEGLSPRTKSNSR